VPPPPAPPSTTSQPNPTKNALPDSKALEKTLENIRHQQEQQTKAGKPNPQVGGAPKTGGVPTGDITAELNAEQRGAIGEKVRECWTKDAGALDLDKMSVQLIVTTDEAGVAHIATVGDEDRARMSDPRFRAFAERAIHAVEDPRCAALPLPKDKLGRVNVLTFRFRP
jgi:hypothetical protein